MIESESRHDQADRIRRRLAEIADERQKLEARLRRLLKAGTISQGAPISDGAVTNQSEASEKIALFRSLFRGREDVFAQRWESARTGKSGYAPACSNEWRPGVCGKPSVKCGVCANQSFLPMSDKVIEGHLRGRHTIGVYPMLPDDTCWFLAADFDGHSWQSDAAAFLSTCHQKQVPAAVERSRSGNGCHVWIFFSEPLPAALARRLGAHLLTETMERKPEIGFQSYDRFFPAQDTMTTGGFGSLIALPLQRLPRESGNSLLVDSSFEPYADQWACMSSLGRMSRADVAAITDDADQQGRVMGVRLPLTDEDAEPWTAPPSRRRSLPPLTGRVPERIRAVLADQIYIARDGLPPGLVNRLIRLAAFQNPSFYSAQSMRRSTFNIPRIIACAELLSHHIALPRGCHDDLQELLEEHGIGLDLLDKRNAGTAVRTAFLGELTSQQQAAAEALLAEDLGVLAATTAFGKTVVAIAAIAARKTNTLVLVHRRQLMEQWIARLNAFLDLPESSIGRIGGGKRKPSGIVDVGMIQSLVRKGEVDDAVADYGHLIVDECHHVSAVSFEAVVRRAKAKFVLGLSATVTRQDGHHPIVFMQCGPIRFRDSAKAQARKRPFSHRVTLRPTSFRMPADIDQKRPMIQQIYAALVDDEERNSLILKDLAVVLEQGRSPIVLTERKRHAEYLARRIGSCTRNVLLLRGGMGEKHRRQVMQRLEDVPDSQERVLIATGRYIGEGFDDARLDTLLLALPISWKGTLVQYVGRLHRLHPEKREVIVYDYADNAVPMLRRMTDKRIRGYKSLGYAISDIAHPTMI